MKLFISFQRGYLKRKDTPQSGELMLFDSFDPAKRTKFYSTSEWKTLDYKDDLQLKVQAPIITIFVLREFAYRSSFVFSNIDFVRRLGTQFGVESYNAKDFSFIYEHQYEEDIIPLDNSYKIK